MNNSKIEASFENRILSVRFLEGAVINQDDLREVYALADEKANGKKYCVIFEALGHYEVEEDAIAFISDNPSNNNVIAKAYVVNTKEAEQKTKLHLLFDHPSLKPYTFKTVAEGIVYLKDRLDASGM